MIKSAIITGHTRGIGLATLNLLEESGVKTRGLSRTNGFDLYKDYEKAKNLIVESDFDIFINNAYVPEKQTMLLRAVYDGWIKKDKLIININNKREQRDFCNRINFDYSKKNFREDKCGLVNLNFDYVGTSFKSKYDKRLFPNLTPKEVADIIWYTICSFKNNICFRDISFHSTRMPQATN